MPKLNDEKRKKLEIQNGSIVIVEDNHAEYITLNEECRRHLAFKEFCDLRYKTNTRGSFRNHNQNYELKNSIGKTSLPYFDGSSKCTFSSWIRKLDTYFKLNPVAEKEAIKLDTLHLDGQPNH